MTNKLVAKMKDRYLNEQEIQTVLQFLKECQFSWDLLLKKYPPISEENKQLLYDVRNFQIKIADDLRDSLDISSDQMKSSGSEAPTSDRDYSFFTSENQDRYVDKMLFAFRKIFSKESGITFDTNFYSSHIALQKNFDVTSNLDVNAADVSLEKKWLDNNEIQALQKEAEHYLNLETDANYPKFKDSIFYARMVHGQNIEAEDEKFLKFKAAYDGAVIANKKIKQYCVNIKNKNSLRAIRYAADTAITKNSAKYQRLNFKLNDEKAIEMESKNILYSKALKKVENSMKRYTKIEKALREEVLGCFSIGGEQHELMRKWLANE